MHACMARRTGGPLNSSGQVVYIVLRPDYRKALQSIVSPGLAGLLRDIEQLQGSATE